MWKKNNIINKTNVLLILKKCNDIKSVAKEICKIINNNIIIISVALSQQILSQESFFYTFFLFVWEN